MAQQQTCTTIKPQGQVRTAASGRLDRGDSALRLAPSHRTLVREHLDPASGRESARLEIREHVPIETIDIEFDHGKTRSGTSILHLADLSTRPGAVLEHG